MDRQSRTRPRPGKAPFIKMWDEVPDVFYTAEEADHHLEMIRPIVAEARVLVATHPGRFPHLEQAFQEYRQYMGEKEVSRAGNS